MEMVNNNIFDDWKHHIGSIDVDGKIITKEKLEVWCNNPNRKLVCIFCCLEPKIINGFAVCSFCNDYKGISPDV